MLLLVVGIIFASGVLIGYRKGLVKIVASLLATLVIMSLVSFVTPYISQLIRTVTPVESSIRNKISGLLLPEGSTQSAESILSGELPRQEQISILEGSKLPGVFREMLKENNNSEIYEALGVDTFGNYVAAYIAKLVSDIIAFLITAVIVTILVRIAIKALGILDKLPLIGGLNRIAGAVVGLGVGLFAVWIMFFVVTLLYDTSLGKACFAAIEASPVLTALYDSNFIMKMATRF